MSIESRLGRIERNLGMEAGQDKPRVLEVAGGERFLVTPRQVRQILEDIWRSNSGVLPKGIQHE